MKEKIFVPMNLDNSGSTGYYIDEGSFLKFAVCLGGAIGITLGLDGLILAKYIPRVPLLISNVVIIVIIAMTLFRFIGLNEASLKVMWRKLNKEKVTDVQEFSDIYDVKANGNVYHMNGHISAFLVVVRGTTIGRSEKELEEYMLTIQNLENKILSYGYRYKRCNLEYPDNSFDVLDDQIESCNEDKMSLLASNLSIKNKYIKSYMEYCAIKECDFFVITAANGSVEFNARVHQMLLEINSPLIFSRKLLNTKKEINELAKMYFDVQVFNIDSQSFDDEITEDNLFR